MNSDRCGLIILHGLGIPFPPEGMSSDIMAKMKNSFGLGVKENCIVKAPSAPKISVAMLPHTYMVNLVAPKTNVVSSWFNFWMLPGLSVVSPVAGESKNDLQTALGWVEGYIEELIDAGVPNKNIVVMGFSQGGALAFYTAVHTKYKIGGFIPLNTWLPLRKVESITALPTPPVNKDTPILHLNGLHDPIVPYLPAGTKTAKEMNKVFTNYELRGVPGTHITTYPLNVEVIRNWIRKNTNIGC